MFHPADPVHNLIKNLLEVQMKPSFVTISLTILVMHVVLCQLGTVIVYGLIVLLSLDLAGFWLQVTMPINIHRHTVTADTYYFITKHVGYLNQNMVICVYRCLQCSVIVPNGILCSDKLVFHSTGMMIIATASLFSLTKCHHELLDESANGILLFVDSFHLFNFERASNPLLIKFDK